MNNIIKIHSNSKIEINEKKIEHALSFILKKFKIKEFNNTINVYVYENSIECGIAYGDEDPSPCSGFTKLPNEIHSINSYSTILHELTHIVLYIQYGKSPIAFLREGFAELFEDNWNGVEYKNLSKQTVSKEDLDFLLVNDNFYKTDCDIAYPKAALFIKNLVKTHGINAALELYKKSVTDIALSIDEIKSLAELV